MDRRRFLLTALAGALAAPLAAEAQEARKTARIGVLDPSSLSARAELLEAFRQGLRNLGYVEGQNIVIDYRGADGRFEQLPDLAAELVRIKVDVIVALTAVAAQAAKQATTTIPIVMVGVGDPVEARLVANLSRPGGNITGSSSLAGALSAKRLELLKEVVPRLARVAALWNAANPMKATDWREAQVAARTLRVSLQSREVRGPADFESVFAAMTKDRPDALLALGDPLLLQQRGRIVEFAARNRLPAMYEHRVYTDAGGLIAYGPDFRELYRQAATYVDKILKGAKPGDLAVQQPTKFDLVINLKTAKALGLTIPPSLLLRADRVIE